jgi:hypothetical protein
MIGLSLCKTEMFKAEILQIHFHHHHHIDVEAKFSFEFSTQNFSFDQSPYWYKKNDSSIQHNTLQF